MQIFYNILYILSISLQLSAGLLLVGSVGTKRHEIIKEYSAEHRCISFEHDGTLADNTALRSTVKSVWINMIAFTYLFLGYLIGIFGETLSSKSMAFIIIIVTVIILYVIPCFIAKYKSEHFKDIIEDELPKTGGVMYSFVDPESDKNDI
ncbi:MAG: hypothetical protein J6I45_10390 [Clostridia bacterium]|nr:hypothetical protein [Clostridia bacterium]